MNKFTKEEINNIINLKGNNKEQIDIFNLYGILFLGNIEKGEYDLTKKFTKFTSHSLPVLYEDFSDSETEEDVIDRFGELLGKIIEEKLL